MAKKKKGRGRGKLKLVKPGDDQCQAFTKAGDRCKRKAKKNGACGLKRHQEQVTGKTFDRREPAKHDAKCKACNHPEGQLVQDLWVACHLTDAEAAERVDVSVRGWQRHAHYKGLYEERARKGILPYLSRIMDTALFGDPKLSAGVAAARLAHTIISGGNKIIIEAMEAAKPQLFEALDKARKLPQDTDLNGLISFLVAELDGKGDDDGTVH